MELKTKRIIVTVLITVVIFLGVCQKLLEKDGYYLIYAGTFTTTLIFLFFALIYYLILTYLAQIKKSWVKQLLSIIVFVTFAFGFIFANGFLFFWADYNYSPHRIFSNPKNGSAIIVYQQDVWLDEPEYRFGVFKFHLFIDVLTEKEWASYDDKVIFNWQKLSPQIIWTEDTATVYMPNDNRIEIWLKR